MRVQAAVFDFPIPEGWKAELSCIYSLFSINFTVQMCARVCVNDIQKKATGSRSLRRCCTAQSPTSRRCSQRTPRRPIGGSYKRSPRADSLTGTVISLLDTALLQWVSEYAVRAYTISDSAASYLNHTQIAVA